MEAIVSYLPHVNASLNALAACLLIIGYVRIKRGWESGHGRAMLAAFAVSVVFLVSYLVYHASTAAVKRFPDYPPDAVRYFYYSILATHIVLAAAVPFLALYSIYLGLRDERTRHVRASRWTLPIWLYVSVTGVIVYVMLYQLYPPR